jgi:hypothetical protein
MSNTAQQDQAVSWDRILKLMFNQGTTVLDVIAAGPDSGPPSTEKKQIVPATPEDAAKMKELGEKAAQAQDEIAVIMGPIATQLKALKDQLMAPVAGQLEKIEEELDLYKDQLLQKMLSHGTKNVRLDDRPPIEMTTTKTKDLTLKELQRILPDKKESKRIWDQVTVKEKNSLKIPQATNPDA